MKRTFALFFIILSATLTLYCDEISDTGFLSIETVPEGIDVFVDGKKVGKSPVTKHEVKSGLRIVSIGSEPCFKSVVFYTFNRNVFVENGKESKVKIVPEPVLKKITVGSVKIDGKELSELPVYVDGVFVGKQPGSFDVPICSHLLEITEASSSRVIQSSTINLLEGSVIERSQRAYEITRKVDIKKEIPLSTKLPSLELQKSQQKLQLTKEKRREIFGGYKWYGVSLMSFGVLTAGLGAVFDHLSYKEFENYKKMGSEERIREEVAKNDFDKELYISNRDKHYSSGYNYSIARTAMYIIGGVSFTTGLVLLFIPKQKTDKSSILVNISPSERGFYIGTTINY